MQETQVRTLVWELTTEPMCPGALSPQLLKLASPRAHAPQEKLAQWEAHARQLESSPCTLQLEKACV